MKITFTPATHKMGSIASISLAPALTCAAGVPCRRKCYASRFIACRPRSLPFQERERRAPGRARR